MRTILVVVILFVSIMCLASALVSGDPLAWLMAFDCLIDTGNLGVCLAG